MARIDVPEGEGTDAVRVWSMRPEMAPAVGKLIDAVYRKSILPTRERELARMRIAQLNSCGACATFRAPSVRAQDISEALYDAVADFRIDERFTAREKLAIEYAERFATDHSSIDDAFFASLCSAFSDTEIVDLTLCLGAFVGLGRFLAVLGLEEADPTFDL
jgi:alkylhydroperoxidase family enzyme